MLVAAQGLVDEHRPPGIDVEVAVEPLLGALQEVGRSCSVACTLFLHVIRCRSKNRHNVPIPTA
ncbi:hypothetical protein [Lichenifustis flavocetrariae]|uniref:hypothetical protein n=1 Tax=Lichenifustis flavocetrariae TaxID=2949735 RepID=UPI003D0AF828